MVDNKRGTTHIERGTIGPHVPNRSDPHLKSMPRMVECHPDNLVMVNPDGVQLGNPQPSAVTMQLKKGRRLGSDC